jgi:hypothetical protein
MATASENELGALHAQVATALKERIANPELCTAADLNAAIKFLKDNNVTMAPDKDNHLGELEKGLANAAANNAVTPASDADLAAALAAVEHMGSAH